MRKLVVVVFGAVLSTVAFGVTHLKGCGLTAAMMALREPRTLDDAQSAAWRNFLRDLRLPTNLVGSEANTQVAALYERRGFTPMHFLDDVIAQHSDIADLAGDLKAEVE